MTMISQFAIFFLVSCITITSATWISSTMTRSEDQMAVGVYNGKIFLIGGYNGGNTQQTMSYDISSKQFNDLGSFALSGSLDGGKGQFYTQQGYYVYIVDRAGSTFDIYNMITQTFTETWNGISINTDVGSVGCLASTSSYLFLTGGGGTSSPLRNLQILSLSTNQWVDNAPFMQDARRRSACIVANGYLWIFGGDTATNERIQVDGITSNAWNYVDPLTETLSKHRCASWSNNIYIVGGENDYSSLNAVTKVHVMDTITGVMTLLSDALPVMNKWSATIAIDSVLYVFGGFYSGNTLTNQYAYYPLISSTNNPTMKQSKDPTNTPSEDPSSAPTNKPSSAPINKPSSAPTHPPSENPSFTSTEAQNPSFTSTEQNPSFTSTEAQNPSFTSTEAQNPTLPPTKRVTIYVQNPTFAPIYARDQEVEAETTESKSDDDDTDDNDTDDNDKDVIHTPNNSDANLIIGVMILFIILSVLCCAAACLHYFVQKREPNEVQMENELTSNTRAHNSITTDALGTINYGEADVKEGVISYELPPGVRKDTVTNTGIPGVLSTDLPRSPTESIGALQHVVDDNSDENNNDNSYVFKTPQEPQEEHMDDNYVHRETCTDCGEMKEGKLYEGDGKFYCDQCWNMYGDQQDIENIEDSDDLYSNPNVDTIC